jgi:hypothetical protein
MATNSRFHDIVWSDLEERILPRDIRRYVQLASVLEPVSEKDGCTTRTKDLCKFQKLEYFLSAGINIGDAFEDLASRIYSTEFPCQTYDLCYRAQADSKKNRRGGRVNQGIIEFLFPIVISQISNQSSNEKEIIGGVPNVLENTTSQDTVWLQRMQNLAFEMSGYYHRTFLITENANILSYYRKRLEDSVKHSDKYHNEEIVNNYSTLRFMIDELSQTDYPSLSGSMQFVYDRVRQTKPNMPTGIIADLTACLIYLKLSCGRTTKIIQ